MYIKIEEKNKEKYWKITINIVSLIHKYNSYKTSLKQFCKQYINITKDPKLCIKKDL